MSGRENGLHEFKLIFKDASGSVIGEPLTATFKFVLDPLPVIGSTVTADQIAAIVGGAADENLK